MEVTLKQLSYLVEVSTTGSFRKAAQRIGMTQPSLSAQIKSLEQHLGVQLVERSAAGAAMTPEGRLVTESAVEILDRVRSLEDVVRNGPLSGVIRLGVKATLGPYLMPSVVKRLHLAYPELRLFISEAAPIDLEAELAAGLHDLILAQLPVNDAEFGCVSLFREPLLLAVAADDPLASRSTYEPEDLRDRDVLTLSPRFHLHEQVVRLCEDNGARLRRDYEGSSLDALRQMVGMGIGVTLMPALYAASEVAKANDVVAIPQKRATLYRSIGVVWRRSTKRTKAIDAFVETVKQAAAEKSAVLSLV